MTLSGSRDAFDRLLGAGLALAVAGFAWACSSGEPSPALWENLAIAAGARPAAVTCDSLWFVIASALTRWFGVDAGLTVLRLLGPLTLGAMAYLFAGVLQMLLPMFLRLQLAEKRSRSLIRRFVILPATLLFCLCEPVWRLGHFFTPDTLHVLMAFVAFRSLVYFRRTFLRRYAVLCFILLGYLASEEPLAIALLVASVSVMVRDAFAIKSSGSLFATTDSTLFAILQRVLTIISVLAVGAGIAVASAYFICNGGLETVDGDGQQALIDFVLAWVMKTTAIATPGGWVYFLGLGVVPLAIAVMPLRRALDIERVLDYRLALCYIGIGVLSFLQLSSFQKFWLWQSNKGTDPVTSSLLLVLAMTAAGLTVAFTLAVLMTEVFFRHYERFSQALFHDAPDEFTAEMDEQVHRRQLRMTWIVANSVPYVLVALSVLWRPNLTEMRMSRAIGDFVRLVADDCAGSPIVVTDGSADAGIELELFRRGERGFKALSMMAGRSSRETYLRRRGEEHGSEDWTALGISSAAALRDWVRTRSDRATNLTVQIGYELWRNNRLPMPQMGATAGRTDAFAPEIRSNLVARAHDLGARMLALAKDGAPNVTSDTELRRIWNFALWRLARAARMRADAADLVEDAETAQNETDFADSLDDENPAYQEVRKRTEWIPRQIHARFTPREGLRFALQQADFVLASTYARQILASNEDDFDANFAMGMYYVTAEQYTRAKKHLEKAHQARPNEPSSLNNLATVEMQLGWLDQALRHAEEALLLAPDTPEVKRTVMHIRREIDKVNRTGKAD